MSWFVAAGTDMSSCREFRGNELRLCIEAYSATYSEIVLNTSHSCDHQLFWGVEEQGLSLVIQPPKGSIKSVWDNVFHVQLNTTKEYFFYFADKRFLMTTFNPSILPQFYITINKVAGFGFIVLEVRTDYKP